MCMLRTVQRHHPGIYNHSGRLKFFSEFLLDHLMRDNLLVMFEIQTLLYSHQDRWLGPLNCERD